MSADIKIFPNKIERDEHIQGEAHCMYCNHKWSAIAPIGTIILECSKCHCMKGVFTNAVLPDAYWQCSCGCCFFVISGISKNIICVVCAKAQKGFE